jgi:hypothetical protein
MPCVSNSSKDVLCGCTPAAFNLVVYIQQAMRSSSVQPITGSALEAWSCCPCATHRSCLHRHLWPQGARMTSSGRSRHMTQLASAASGTCAPAAATAVSVAWGTADAGWVAAGSVACCRAAMWAVASAAGTTAWLPALLVSVSTVHTSAAGSAPACRHWDAVMCHGMLTTGQPLPVCLTACCSLQQMWLLHWIP